MAESKYTQVFIQILQKAKDIAVTRKHQFLLPVHFLKAMLAEKIPDDTVVFDALNKANVDFKALNSELDDELNSISSVEGQGDTKIEYGNLANQDFSDFLNEIKAQQDVLGDDYIAPDEALLAALANKDLDFTKFMKKQFKLNYDSVKDLLLKVRNGEKVIAANSVRGSSVLDKYGVDLVAQAQRGKMDPVIGREMETRQVIQVLLRKKKNNPLLLANPGVGKTAIVEGLAQKIAKGDVPDTLKGVKLYSLDLTALTAGASVRGAFEGRIEAVLKEVERSEGRILLFIDEVHNIVGAGGAKGHGDASNILKPALARGKLHLIAATTIMEFKKYIEGDGALTRRFAPINVDEPTTAQAIAILRGLRPKFESFYGVTYHDDALIEAVKMSQRYIADRYLPDKAIELIDSAGSTIKLDTTSTPPELDSDERKLLEAQTARLSLMREDSIHDEKELSDLEKNISNLKQKIAVEKSNWEQAKKVLQNIKALRIKLHEDLNKLNALSDDNAQRAPLTDEIKQLKSDIENQRKNLNGINDSVTASVIDDIVAEQTGIDVKQLQESEKERLLNMPKLLHESVIGQDQAVQTISNAIKRSRTGLSSPNRPIGSFLFMGPSGVGKTQLAKAVSKTLFGSEKDMIRIDMSEYQSKASITRLIGSPPGYVGYDEAGQLTEKVRLHPYSVVLFDEMEKAHPDVLNLLLQLLDDGRLTDGKGRTINFKNTIIIATSNLGAAQIVATWKDPKAPLNDTTKSVVMSTLYHHFRPEFVNRWDQILIFKPLDYDDQKNIAKLYMKELHDRLLANSGIKLQITEKALDFIAVDSYNKELGARPLRRYIQDHIEATMADAILEDKYKYGDTMQIIREKGLNGYGKVKHRLALGTLEEEKEKDPDPIRVSANPPE